MAHVPKISMRGEVADDIMSWFSVNWNREGKA
jgi:hypothetical protein